MQGMSETNHPSPRSDQPKRFPLRLALFGAVSVVSVAFGFLAFSVNDSRILVQRYGYYSIAITFAWALVAMSRVVPEWVRNWPRLSRKELITLVMTIVGLTAVALMTVPYTYKVLYDEFVLQATTWVLHESREVGAIVLGYEIEGTFSTMQTYLDKRPFFFAFLVSLIHDLTGYREANAFFLNTALMPVALGFVYLLARRLVEHLAAMATLCGFGALSLLAIQATGAGMEMLNLVMLLLVIHLALWYLDHPDESRLAALVLAAVLLAQSRYESSLYVAPVALLVLEGWRRKGALILPAAAVLAPALLIPYALHNTYLSGTPLMWELREGEASRFSIVYLADNLVHAAQFFFNFSGKLTNSWWLGVAGFPALIWAIWIVGKNVRQWRVASPTSLGVSVFGAAIIANLGLLMLYYWGQLDDAIVSRLSLPFTVLLALSIGWAVTQFPKKWHRSVALFAIGGALFSYWVSGLVGNAMHWTLNQQAREIAWEIDTVEAAVARAPGARLILTNKSALIWLAKHSDLIQIVRARARGEAIGYHLDQHTFKEILVMQTYRPVGPEGGFQLDPLDRLPDNFLLEPVIERRFGSHISRISRVKEILPVEKPVETDASSAELISKSESMGSATDTTEL